MNPTNLLRSRTPRLVGMTVAFFVVASLLVVASLVVGLPKQQVNTVSASPTWTTTAIPTLAHGQSFIIQGGQPISYAYAPQPEIREARIYTSDVVLVGVGDSCFLALWEGRGEARYIKEWKTAKCGTLSKVPGYEAFVYIPGPKAYDINVIAQETRFAGKRDLPPGYPPDRNDAVMGDVTTLFDTRPPRSITTGCVHATGYGLVDDHKLCDLLTVGQGVGVRTSTSCWEGLVDPKPCN